MTSSNTWVDSIQYYQNANWSQGTPPPMNDPSTEHSIPARIKKYNW